MVLRRLGPTEPRPEVLPAGRNCTYLRWATPTVWASSTAAFGSARENRSRYRCEPNYFFGRFKRLGLSIRGAKATSFRRGASRLFFRRLSDS
jgi:hypothetical protein